MTNQTEIEKLIDNQESVLNRLDELVALADEARMNSEDKLVHTLYAELKELFIQQQALNITL